MRRLIRGLRPTPALVIACLSLFVAMGGVGYAALNGKDKKRVRSIADQEISKQACGSVANAQKFTVRRRWLQNHGQRSRRAVRGSARRPRASAFGRHFWRRPCLAVRAPAVR